VVPPAGFEPALPPPEGDSPVFEDRWEVLVGHGIAGLEAFASVDQHRPLSVLVCTRCVPAKINCAAGGCSILADRATRQVRSTASARARISACSARSVVAARTPPPAGRTKSARGCRRRRPERRSRATRQVPESAAGARAAFARHRRRPSRPAGSTSRAPQTQGRVDLGNHGRKRHGGAIEHCHGEVDLLAGTSERQR